MSDMGVPAVENFDQSKVEANTNADKGTMLQALAQGGTDLAKQVAATESTMASGINAALAAAQGNASHSAVAGDPNFAREQAAGIAGQGDYFKGVLGAQGASQQRYMSNLGAANSRYMAQVNAAIPITHAQTERELQSLSSAARSAQADRALRQQIASMQLEETKARISAAAADRDKSNANADLERRVLQQRVESGQRDLDHPGWDRAPQDRNPDDIRRARDNAYTSIMNDVQGGWTSNGAQALQFVFNQAKTLPEAEAALSAVTGDGLNVNGENVQFQTPGKKKLSTDYLRQYLGRYYGA